MASDIRPPNKVREKVALKPGFHLRDWITLSRKATDLRGVTGPPRPITIEELAQHCTKLDCWTAYKGKVYNLTPYLPYHPGGENILMDVAGKDCTELFDKYHRWVNADAMLSKCYLGTLFDPNLTVITEEAGQGDDDSDDEGEKSEREGKVKAVQTSLLEEDVKNLSIS
eukprot:gene8742-9632_t